jgi:phosphotransferase system HPr-like phosphotransfer protein
MQTFTYKLNKDLCGRSASLLNWKLNDFPFQINIYANKNRVINAKSLIGLLSANLKENSFLTFAINDDIDIIKLKEKLNELDFLQEV